MRKGAPTHPGSRVFGYSLPSFACLRRDAITGYVQDSTLVGARLSNPGASTSCVAGCETTREWWVASGLRSICGSLAAFTSAASTTDAFCLFVTPCLEHSLVNLHALIATKGFRTVTAVARRAVVTPEALNGYVAGRYPWEPYQWFAERVARVLGVTEEDVRVSIRQSRDEFLARDGVRLRVLEVERANGVEAERRRRAGLPPE